MTDHHKREMANFIAQQKDELLVIARRVGHRSHDGQDCEDAVQTVIREMLDLIDQTPPCPQGASLDYLFAKLRTHARARLPTILDTVARKARRQASLRSEHGAQIIGMTAGSLNPPVPHPFYDESFLVDFLNEVAQYPVAQKIVTAFINLELKLDETETAASGLRGVARQLGVSPEDARRALRDIRRIRSTLIAERLAADRKEPAR